MNTGDTFSGREIICVRIHFVSAFEFKTFVTLAGGKSVVV